MGRPGLPALCIFWEEIGSTCFGLVNKQVISVLLAYIAFIVPFTDQIIVLRTRMWGHDLSL